MSAKMELWGEEMFVANDALDTLHNDRLCTVDPCLRCACVATLRYELQRLCHERDAARDLTGDDHA